MRVRHVAVDTNLGEVTIVADGDTVVGDAFQRSVWALVAQVGYGQTTTYGAIAGQLGDKALAQRVGQAVGANPVCVLIPCHRVVSADGSLTGYATAASAPGPRTESATG